MERRQRQLGIRDRAVAREQQAAEMFTNLAAVVAQAPVQEMAASGIFRRVYFVLAWERRKLNKWWP